MAEEATGQEPVEASEGQAPEGGKQETFDATYVKQRINAIGAITVGSYVKNADINDPQDLTIVSVGKFVSVGNKSRCGACARRKSSEVATHRPEGL